MSCHADVTCFNACCNTAVPGCFWRLSACRYACNDGFQEMQVSAAGNHKGIMQVVLTVCHICEGGRGWPTTSCTTRPSASIMPLGGNLQMQCR